MADSKPAPVRYLKTDFTHGSEQRRVSKPVNVRYFKKRVPQETGHSLSPMGRYFGPGANFNQVDQIQQGDDMRFSMGRSQPQGEDSSDVTQPDFSRELDAERSRPEPGMPRQKTRNISRESDRQSNSEASFARSSERSERPRQARPARTKPRQEPRRRDNDRKSFGDNVSGKRAVHIWSVEEEEYFRQKQGNDAREPVDFEPEKLKTEFLPSVTKKVERQTQGVPEGFLGGQYKSSIPQRKGGVLDNVVRYAERNESYFLEDTKALVEKVRSLVPMGGKGDGKGRFAVNAAS